MKRFQRGLTTITSIVIYHLKVFSRFFCNHVCFIPFSCNTYLILFRYLELTTYTLELLNKRS